LSIGRGGGNSTGDGGEVVIVDEEENDMERMRNTEESHLKMKEK